MKNLYGESVCIIAPHPDDEVLGLGGSISKMVNSGIKVNLLVVKDLESTSSKVEKAKTMGIEIKAISEF